MSSEMNAFKNGYTVKSEQRKLLIDQNVIGRTIKHLAAPVFDFFTKEDGATEEQNPFIDYDEAIKSYEMKSAVIQQILNDADPKSRTTMNVVI